ncbi:MAG: hypothetical protein LBO72_08095 [Helicobacteraceae bacterium]|jgi:hypothetical protein|nr:hypothetical protein [Helicobacteraceae bacterium]
MSKVFSAKLNSVEFEYELGGAKAAFNYRSPTTLEIDAEITSEAKEGATLIAASRAKLRERLEAKGAIDVEELIADQEKNGNLYEFIGALEALLQEERAKKK